MIEITYTHQFVNKTKQKKEIKSITHRVANEWISAYNVVVAINKSSVNVKVGLLDGRFRQNGIILFFLIFLKEEKDNNN